MANKVTIQDIADALGVSRNTVSKAINNTGILADATREKVLAKAVEMGCAAHGCYGIVLNRLRRRQRGPGEGRPL